VKENLNRNTAIIQLGTGVMVLTTNAVKKKGQFTFPLTNVPWSYWSREKISLV
jgi:hypothetical protein